MAQKANMRPFTSCYFIDESGCWLWSKYTNYKGYGTFWTEGRVWMAHRYSYKIHKGEIPKDLQVQHTCDTPNCVNPEHLFVGTNQENVNQKMNRGRYVVPRTMTDTLTCRYCKREIQHATWRKHENFCKTQIS